MPPPSNSHLSASKKSGLLPPPEQSTLTSQHPRTEQRPWHSIKGKYHGLISPSELPQVEKWYNAHATDTQRMFLRDIMKAVLGIASKEGGTEGYESQHKFRHMVRLYGVIFAPTAKPLVERYLGVVASKDESKLDAFREVFSSILASKKLTRTTYTDEFQIRERSDRASSHRHHIYKYNWESEKLGNMLRDRHRHTLEMKRALLSARSTKAEDYAKMFGEEAAHAVAERRTNHQEANDALELLADAHIQHQLKKTGRSHMYVVDDVTGQTMFRAAGARGERDCVKSRLPLQQQPNTTQHWAVTSRALYRTMQPRDIMRTVEAARPPEAAIVRVTASNGIVIPRMPTHVARAQTASVPPPQLCIRS
eukprot:PhM_4_TR2907/c0_g1_i1/m.55230